MKRTLHPLVLILTCAAALYLQGCASTESLVIHAARPAYAQSCGVRWYSIDTETPADAMRVATAEYSDSGFSVSCSPGRVRRVLHERACEVGANAIKIAKESYPDIWSTCYRATADLLHVPNIATRTSASGTCLLPSGHLRLCAG